MTAIINEAVLVRQVGGKVAVPTAPGLGGEVDRAVIDRYRAA